MSLLPAMFAVIASWMLLVLILCGVGLALQFLFGFKKLDAPSLLLSPWNGFALVLLFLQSWHFLFAIRWPTFGVCAAAGAAGLFAARRELTAFAKTARVGWKLWTILILLALWLANRAIGPGNAMDSGVYHFQVVRWSHEHPIVPGLANLHPLFALNNSCHLFVALLQVGPWEGRANHLANGLLLFIWLATVAISAASMMRGDDRSRAQNIFNLVLLIPLIWYAVGKESSSPTTDLPQAAVAFACASSFLWLLNARRGVDPGRLAFTTVSIILLAAASLCIKLSAGALAVPMAVAALTVYLVRAPSSPAWRMTTVAWSCGLSFALTSTWAGRGIVLSGCPLYPSTAFAVPVEWRPRAFAAAGLRPEFRSDSQLVRVGMLKRAVNSPGFQHLPSWIAQPIWSATESSSGTTAWLLALVFASSIEVPLPIVLAIIALSVLMVRTIRGKSIGAIKPIEWLFFVAPTISLTFWAITAPEPRYGACSFWIVAAALISMTARQVRGARALVWIALALSALPVGYRALIQAFNPAAEPVSTVLFVPPGPDHGFHPTPVVQLEPFQTVSGLILPVPTPGNPCWDSPLPATSAPHPLLRLRIPDDLESGFVLDSDSPVYIQQ